MAVNASVRARWRPDTLGRAGQFARARRMPGSCSPAPDKRLNKLQLQGRSSPDCRMMSFASAEQRGRRTILREMPDPRVLVVEDDAHLRGVLQRGLGEEGFDVAVVGRG